jgi:probable phosphoglycerate mutase
MKSSNCINEFEPCIESDLFSTPFYYLRHGETDWNNLNLFQGRTDIPLNNHGIEQARKAAAMIQNKGIATIASSPLLRAAQTAQIIAQAISAPIVYIDDLKEGFLGSLEGTPKSDPAWVDKWRSGAYQAEGVEPWTLFTQRVMKAIQQALELPGPVLIVAHGGVYRAIQDALGLPLVGLPNCVPVLHKPSKK